MPLPSHKPIQSYQHLEAELDDIGGQSASRPYSRAGVPIIELVFDATDQDKYARVGDNTRNTNFRHQYSAAAEFDDDDVEDGSGVGENDAFAYKHQRQNSATHSPSAGIAPTTDDPSTPSLTLRVIAIGTAWCIVLGIVNAVLSFRTTPFGIPSFLATLLSYPMGLFAAQVLPNYEIIICGHHWLLNPGPFGIKEHVLITIIASAGASVGYGIDNVVTQKSHMFMGNDSITFIQALAWVLTSQFIGFGLAGLARRYLVCPPAMVWPGILSTVALFVSFHSNHYEDKHSSFKISRFSFFWIAFTAAFCYTWIPQFFLTALQSFSPLCLLTQSRWLRFLASSENRYGVGIGALTLDWYYVGGSQLTTPWWATVNLAVSNVFFAWIVTPLIFYSDAFGMDQRLHFTTYPDGSPIPTLNSAGLFNRNGTPISAVSLYKRPSFDLDEKSYKHEAPIYITTFFALSYAAWFLAITAAFMHVALWHGDDISRQMKVSWKQIRNSKKKEDLDVRLGSTGDGDATDDEAVADGHDIHGWLMQAYPEVSERFYLSMLVCVVLTQILITSLTPFTMPIWAVVLCLSMAACSLLPIGIITAISGQKLGINIMTEFAIGLLIPGKTVAVMAFKSLGTNSVIQAITLLGDLKLGHYLHINPVHMLFAQLYGSFIGALANTSSSFWVMDGGMRSMLGKGEWQATGYFIFFNAGAIWGAIGPQRFFGIGSVYQSTLWFFLVGLILPFVPWGLNRRWPSRLWKLVHIPLLASFDGPGRLQNFYIVPVTIAWVFQRYIYRRHHEWWLRYNYLLSIALDSGVGACVLAVAIVTQWGASAPVWALNPDVGNGVPIDYYCFDRGPSK